MESEGIIRYRLDYRPSALPESASLTSLFSWFVHCREKALIGQDPTRYGGYAYGNISHRFGDGFLISGTQTGGQPSLEPSDLAWVQRVDPLDYSLAAGGPSKPSSEAMTHGQIYLACPGAHAVIHCHSPLLWGKAAQLGLATTDPSAANGTPQIAAAVGRLVSDAAMSLPRVFTMGGHQDGVIAYGQDMDSAGELLLDLLADAERVDAEQQTDRVR